MGISEGRSCIDQLFTFRQLGEKIIEKKKRMLIFALTKRGHMTGLIKSCCEECRGHIE